MTVKWSPVSSSSGSCVIKSLCDDHYPVDCHYKDECDGTEYYNCDRIAVIVTQSAVWNVNTLLISFIIAFLCLTS